MIRAEQGNNVDDDAAEYHPYTATTAAATAATATAESSWTPSAGYPTSGTRGARRDGEEADGQSTGARAGELGAATEGPKEGELEGEGAGPDEAEGMASWAGHPAIKGSSESMRMALLTFSLIGLQFTWGIEMTYCTPYLLSLGLTKSRTSLVWIAGPLSGLIMQPIVGVIADGSRSKYGRRRPFMMLGSVLVAFGLIILGWTKEIVALFIADTDTAKTCTIVLAVLAIYAVDFAVNAVMLAEFNCRHATYSQAADGVGLGMVAIGHLIGYCAGTVDLVGLFGTTFGDSQFKQLALIAAAALILSNGVTSWAVTERILISGRGEDAKFGGIKILRQIIRTMLHLPSRIQSICWAQFWAWIGWFPFLFYGSTWVGETYFRFDAPHDVKDSKDALGDIGRVGSMALVVYSLVTFTGAFLLPLLIHSPDETEFTPRPPSSIAGVVTTFTKYRPDLLTAWFCGHFMFAGAMLMAPFAASFRFATVLVALCGIPWVLGSWAPYAFLGVEVNRLGGGASSGSAYRRLSADDSIELERPDSAPSMLRLEHDAEEVVSSTGELSGIYFGILNIYTTLPQFIGTFISMIVFSILEPGTSPELAHDTDPEEHHGTDGPNAIAVCLFIGALSTLGAAYATSRLR